MAERLAPATYGGHQATKCSYQAHSQSMGAQSVADTWASGDGQVHPDNEEGSSSPSGGRRGSKQDENATWGAPPEVSIEGWMKKKSHHVGRWKERFFRFDGRSLEYWNKPQEKLNHPRGVIKLNGCLIAAYENCRFVIQGVNGRFDEEFMAKSVEDRDKWVSSLNAAALKFRVAASAQQVETNKFLVSKGLQEPLELAVGAEVDAGPDSCGSHAAAVLAHTRFGNVLLRSDERVLEPRQGKMVMQGRRALRHWRRRSIPKKEAEPEEQPGMLEDRWLLLLSSKDLDGVIADAQDSAVRRWPQRRMVPHLTAPPFPFTTDFEALHAYADPHDGAPPVASLPLKACFVSAVLTRSDGSGYSIQVEAEDQTKSMWTLVFPAEADAREWRAVVMASRWSAEARAVGRRRAIAELLTVFDASPEGWRASAGQCLSDAASKVWNDGGGSKDAADEAVEAVNRVLEACEDIACEAEDLLDAALQSRPLRRDVCEAVLEGALEPALRLLGQVWFQWNSVLQMSDARRMLSWLEGREYTMQRLGVICAPLSTLFAGLLSELTLRMGGRLKRIMKELLVRELRGTAPASSPVIAPSSPPMGGGRAGRRPSGGKVAPPSSGSLAEGSSQRSGSQPPVPSSPSAPAPLRMGQRPVSSLPVDLFTMLHSCLPLEQDVDVLALRVNAQRIAKFVVWNVQDALFQWLLAEQPGLSKEVCAGTALQIGRGDSVPCTRPIQWFASMSKIANAIPALWAQCREFDEMPLMLSGNHGLDEYRSDKAGSAVLNRSTLSRLQGETQHLENDVLGTDALPREWGLKAESVRFEALSEAYLWGVSDVATARFRYHTAAKEPLDLLHVLTSQLGGVLHLLFNWMEPLTFEQLLPKVFHVCLACCLVRLARGLRFKDPGGRLLSAEEQLSQNAPVLCDYFNAALAGNCLIQDDDESQETEANVLHSVPWHPPAVLSLFRQARSATSTSQFVLPRSEAGGNAPDMPGLRGLLAAFFADAPHSPLPLREVLRSFGCDGPLLEQFAELPPEVPPGGTFLPLNGPASPRASPQAPVGRTPPEPISWGGNRTFATALEGGVCEMRVEDSGAYGLFCSVVRRESLESRKARSTGGDSFTGRSDAGDGPTSISQKPHSSSVASCSGNRTSGIRSMETASHDGDAQERGQRSNKPHGASNISSRPHRESQRRSSSVGASAAAPSDAGSRQTSRAPSVVSTPGGSMLGENAVPLRRRWLQLAKGRPGTVPSLEIMASHPQTPRDGGSDVKEVFPLVQLVEVNPKTTTLLDLVFALPDDLEEDDDLSDDGMERVVVYTCFFDNPSHLLRWRLVLEAWWASDPVREPRPVASLGSRTSATELDACWGGLPGRLTRRHLQERLGSLWQDVKPQL